MNWFHSTVVNPKERQECLAYYEEEKRLRLLYERVEQLFDKSLGKYEDEYFQARKHYREFWSSMEKIFEVREYISHAGTEIVKRKKEMRVAPSAASAMSSAWEAAYLDYEAKLDPSNIVASSDSRIVAIQQQRAKELSVKLNKSLQKAWEEERKFRKYLGMNNAETRQIADKAARNLAKDKWLRRLEAQCP